MFVTFDPINEEKPNKNHHDHDNHSDEGHEYNDGHHNTSSSVNELPTAQIALDIVETRTSMIIIAPIAGVALEDIDITLSKNILTISGERQEPEITEEVEKTLLSECFFGLFSRSVILPENLEYTKIAAEMQDNLLTIRIPKIILPSKTVPITKKS
ncbi:MAG: Hsp20/alpha crystallin family protein [Candidatus Gracilibacteria bacterium]